MDPTLVTGGYNDGVGPGPAIDGFGSSLAPDTWRAESMILGRWLRNTIALRGGPFGAGAAALFGATFAAAAACSVTVIDAENLAIVTPLCETTGRFTLWVAQDTAGPWIEMPGYRVVDDGYRLLRALQPPQRYTENTTDPRNVLLAAIGLQLDRIEAARISLREQELFPDTAEVLLWRHEQKYGLTTNTADDLDERRLRVDLARRASPRISVPWLQRIVDAVLDTEIVENEDYDVFGDLIWQYQVYEPSPNYLNNTTRAALVRALQAAGPGYTVPRVGHADFVLGTSRVGRDFL